MTDKEMISSLKSEIEMILGCYKEVVHKSNEMSDDYLLQINELREKIRRIGKLSLWEFWKYKRSKSGSKKS